MQTKIVQINLYLLSDSTKKRTRRKFQSDLSNSFSYQPNTQTIPYEKGKISTFNIESSSNLINDEIEISGTIKTVKQTIHLIYSKTMKIKDIALFKKQQTTNRMLIHCFISSSSSLQFSNSPSLTLRGIGINSNNNTNSSINNSSNGNSIIINSSKENSEINSSENLRLDETHPSFISENPIITESDELFFVGKDRTETFIVKFDNSTGDIGNSTISNINNISESIIDDSDIDYISPKTCSLPYDIVCVASDGFWTAICGKDAVIRLYKKNSNVAIGSNFSSGNFGAKKSDKESLAEFLESGKQPVHSILSFCNSIICCEILSSFDTMVCGTKDASLMICSLSRGTITYDISIRSILKNQYKNSATQKSENDELDFDNIELKKLLVTQSWGFILACVDAIRKNDGKVVHIVCLFNINGNLIRIKEIHFVVSCWTSWSCEKGFDYVLLSDENGKLFMFEAFYLNILRPFYRCQRQIICVKCIFEEKIIIAVSKEGRVFFVPYKPVI